MRYGLLLFTVLATLAHAQTADVPAGSDSVRVDSARVDSLARLQATLGDSVVLVADSAAAARVDSAAVEALTDTTEIGVALGQGVEVVFFGRRIFRVWGALGAYSAEERARRLGERLEAFARNRTASLDSLRVVDGETLTTIQAGDLILMSVTDDDAAALAMLRPQAALRYERILRDEIGRYREQLTAGGLVRSGALAVAMLAMLIVLLRGLGWLFLWLHRRAAPLRRRWVRPVRLGNAELIGRADVSRLVHGAVVVLRVALSLVLVYVFATAIFGLFPWTQSWSENLLAYALSPLRRLGTLVVEGAPDLVAIVVIVAVVRLLMRLSDYLFRRIEAGEIDLADFEAELAEPTRKIAKFLLVLLGVMLVYPYTPIVDSPVFQGLTIFLGVLFSLGSSTAISNMVAGVVLTYTLAFRVGDRVRVGDTFGDVVEKAFLVTRIRTPKNEEVAIPNAAVLGGHIINYSRRAREGEGVILHTTVTIGYDVPWPRVHALLTQAALDTDGIEREPPPFVLQTSLGDFSVAYELNAYTCDVRRMSALYSGLHQHIQTRFAEAGIEILSPTYHARRDGPSTVPDLPTLRADAAP